MSAYVIVEIDVKDPTRYEDYKSMAPSSIAVYGGRYLVRGGRTDIFEGDWNPKRVVVLQSNGRRGSVRASGTVDEVKDEIETVLEGGREAFQRRKERYGY